MKQQLLDIIKDSERVWVDNIDEKYYSDKLGRIKVRPRAVILPLCTTEVAEVTKFANNQNISIIPRGANTGLTGATIPVTRSEERRVGKEWLRLCRSRRSPYQ